MCGLDGSALVTLLPPNYAGDKGHDRDLRMMSKTNGAFASLWEVGREMRDASPFLFLGAALGSFFIARLI